MEARIIIQDKNDTPQLADIKQPILDCTDNHSITFCVVEGGMASGEPSVIIVSENEMGSIVLSTSLDKFLAAATAMATGAKAHWNWSLPTGHVTIMPLYPKVHKALLKSIKKDLEE